MFLIGYPDDDSPECPSPPHSGGKTTGSDHGSTHSASNPKSRKFNDVDAGLSKTQRSNRAKRSKAKYAAKQAAKAKLSAVGPLVSGSSGVVGQGGTHSRPPVSRGKIHFPEIRLF